MGKVRYKEPSINFVTLYSKENNSKLRASVGRDGAVGEYYFLSIDNLIPYEKQARKNFDEQEIRELSETISEHGVQSPLLVIPSTSQIDKFEVVSGERRLRAAKLIGLEKLPCIIINAEKAEEVALIENIQRADLHPVEVGDSIKSLLAKATWGDVSKLAEKLGKSQSTISNYLSYSKLPQDIKKFIIENNIRSRDILRRVLKCENIKDMEELLGIKGSGRISSAMSILRISLDLENVFVQDKNLARIPLRQRGAVVSKLKDLIDKIEKMGC